MSTHARHLLGVQSAPWSRVPWPPAAVAAAALAVAGCGAGLVSGEQRVDCFRGDDPRSADARAALRRAETGSPVERACAMEAVPASFHDYSDEVGAPDCAPSLLARLDAAIFARSPVRYSRLLLAEIIAIARVPDTTDVMDEKARLLRRLVQLRDAEIGDYERSPEETGPPPPRELVRRIALYGLVASNLFLNVRAAREWLIARAAAPRTAEEALLMRSVVEQQYSEALWGHPQRSEDARAVAQLGRDLADVERRLDSEGSEPGFELALKELRDVAYFAERFGLAARAARLVDRIVSARGALPLAAGRRTAAHDLYVAGLLAEQVLASHPDGVRSQPLAEPARESQAYDVIATWIQRELYEARGIRCGPSEDEPGAALLAELEAERPVAADSALVLPEYLATHPEVIRSSASARRWLVARMENPREEHGWPVELIVIERALPPLLASTAPGDEPLARAAIERLIARVNADLAAPAPTNIYDNEATWRALHLIGRWSDAHGMSAVAEELLARAVSSRYRGPAAIAQRLRLLAPLRAAGRMARAPRQ